MKRLALVVAVLLACASLASAQQWVSMTPGTWYAYPSSNADAAKQAENTYPDYSGGSSVYYNQCEGGPTSNVGFSAIMSAWSGGAFDQPNKKLYIWGGGHGDYCGNEVLSFNLLTGAWVRETDRWLYVDQGTSGAGYTDSLWEQPYGAYGLDAANSAPSLVQPRSTHTYNALQWVPSRNGFCSFGMPSTSHGSVTTPASHLMWCFNASTKAWSNQGSVDTSIFSTMRYELTSPDPRDANTYWVHSSTYGAAMYKCTAPVGSSSVTCVRKSPYNDIPDRKTGVMDNAGRFWAIGGDNTRYPTQMGTFDLTNNLQSADLADVSTSGDIDMESARAPGVCYLPNANRIVAWSGGADIFVLNPDTRVWTKRAPDGSNSVTPSAAATQGTFGRLRCDEANGYLVAVNSTSGSVYLYRFPSDLANPPAHSLQLANNGPITVPLATAQNTGTSATVTVTASGSPITLVTFSAPGAGSPTFTPATCTPSGTPAACSTTFAYPANPSAQAGTFPVTVTASDSFPATAQTTVTFIVQPAVTSFGNVGTLQHRGPATPEQLSLWMPFTGGGTTGGVPSTVTASLRHRAVGSGSWTTGHDLARVRPEVSQPGTATAVTPGFSWPVIDLTPGTSYEVEVTLHDGAASEVRTATMTTRALPGVTGTPNKFATLGMNGSQLRSLVSSLQPGDILEIPAGTYNIDDSPIQMDASGTANNPIVIRGASKTGTIISRPSGGQIFYIVFGNHVRIENMTLQGRGTDPGTQSDSTAVYMWSNTRPQNIVMRDLIISGVDKCLIGTAMDSTLFYGNVCYGNNQWNATFLQDNRTWNDDATNMPGTGNAAFNNTYRDFGDCASFAFGGHADVENVGIYFYRNDYNGCGDDLVEVDHLYGPGAFYDNRAYNVMTCLSIDPLYGGPFLFARNICINSGRQTFKFTDGNSTHFTYNNTFASTDKNQSFQAGLLSFFSGNNPNNFGEGNPQAAWGLENNIFVYCEGTGRPMYWETGFWVESDGVAHVDWTHNSWAVGGDTRFTVQPNTYADLAAAIANSLTTGPVFSGATKRFTSDTIIDCQPFTDNISLSGTYLTRQNTLYDLTVKAGQTAKNSGRVIAGVTDGYSGAAPDRGALIEGRAAVTYGASGAPTPQDPPGVPAAPSNLRTTSTPTPTLVQLAWDFTSVPANLEQGFRVYRKLSAGSYGAPTFTVAAGTLLLNDNTVVANTDYKYKVASYNGTGESAASAEITVNVPDTGGGELTGAVPILSYYPAYGVSTANTIPALEQATLAKMEFQGLAPWYCVAGRYTLGCTMSQSDMDLQMQIAAAAGIKAFAFNWYGDRSATAGPSGPVSLQVPYTFFQSSAQTGVKFALILPMGYLGATNFVASTTNWHANVAAIAAILDQANYQTVLSGRPILFLQYGAGDGVTYFGGSLANVATAVAYLRTLTAEDPYVVLVDAGTGSAAHTKVADIGADALSSLYVSLAPASASATKTYAAQDAAIQAHWDTLAAEGDEIVPIVQLVGGRRVKTITPAPQLGGGTFYQRMGTLVAWTKGSASAVAAGQITAVGAYLADNPSVVPSKAMLIYNATDPTNSGYPVLPTIGDPPQSQPPYTAGASSGLTTLLNAIGPILYSYR